MAGIYSRVGEKKTHNPRADDRKRYAISILNVNINSVVLSYSGGEAKDMFMKKWLLATLGFSFLPK